MSATPSSSVNHRAHLSSHNPVTCAPRLWMPTTAYVRAHSAAHALSDSPKTASAADATTAMITSSVSHATLVTGTSWMSASRAVVPRRRQSVPSSAALVSDPPTATSPGAGAAGSCPSTSGALRRSFRIAAAADAASRRLSTPRRSARFVSAAAAARSRAASADRQDAKTLRDSSSRRGPRRSRAASSARQDELSRRPCRTPSSAANAYPGNFARGHSLAASTARKDRRSRGRHLPHAVPDRAKGRTPNTAGALMRSMGRDSSMDAMTVLKSTTMAWPLEFLDLAFSPKSAGFPADFDPSAGAAVAPMLSVGKRGRQSTANDGRPDRKRLALVGVGGTAAASIGEGAPPSGYRRKRESSPPKRYSLK